jgi:PIN domain nuclease of toxin-antitoxin system
MTLLLDTHIWIWWLLGSQRLACQERTALDRLAEAGSLRISAISLWEAQMLHAKGSLRLDRPFENWIREASASDLLRVLPLDVYVVIALNALPPSFHGDPADRLIVATSRCHGMALATYDEAIRSSGVAAIWSWRVPQAEAQAAAEPAGQAP